MALRWLVSNRNVAEYGVKGYALASRKKATCLTGELKHMNESTSVLTSSSSLWGGWVVVDNLGLLLA